MPRFPVCDVIVIVYSHAVWHFQGAEVQVHIDLSDRNALEYFDSWLEGVDWNANFSFPIFVPVLLKKLGVLAGSFLHLNVRVSFEASDHLVNPLFVGKLLVKLQQA